MYLVDCKYVIPILNTKAFQRESNVISFNLKIRFSFFVIHFELEMTEMSDRQAFAKAFYLRIVKNRILSLSHFNSQWLQFVYIIGCHPISFTRPLQKIPGAKYLFHFSLFSWVTLYTAIILSITVTYFLLWFLELHYNGTAESFLDEYYQ